MDVTDFSYIRFILSRFLSLLAWPLRLKTSLLICAHYCSVTLDLSYEIKIASYSQQMDELQKRQCDPKATAGRFAEVKYWMDAFKEHVHSGEKMDTTDAVVLRQLADRIVVYDDRLEIHLQIDGTLEQKYL